MVTAAILVLLLANLVGLLIVANKLDTANERLQRLIRHFLEPY